MYGVNSAQQAAAVRHNVVANGSIGVPQFDFSLHPGFLVALGGSWTIGQLAADVCSPLPVPATLPLTPVEHIQDT